AWSYRDPADAETGRCRAREARTGTPQGLSGCAPGDRRSTPSRRRIGAWWRPGTVHRTPVIEFIALSKRHFSRVFAYTSARPPRCHCSPHMLRHACGFKLANDGHDTRALQHYLGHKNIQHTVRYTEMAPDRFKDFWRG